MDVSHLLDELNEAQRKAVTTESQHTLVLAGAGSGKTRVLIHRLAWLIQVEHVSPHSILAVTFTNKAAGEMRSRIGQELGRDPTIEEIADELELAPEKVSELRRIAQDPVSLEMPLGEEDDSTLGDFVEDPDAEIPVEAASFKLLQSYLSLTLEGLNERERDVLVMRFGLADGKVRTLEEVGTHFSVTRERIRQIETKALAKLRQPARARKLEGYLEGA